MWFLYLMALPVKQTAVIGSGFHVVKQPTINDRVPQTEISYERLSDICE